MSLFQELILISLGKRELFIPSFTYSPFLYRKYKKFFKRCADRQFANYDKTVVFAYPTPGNFGKYDKRNQHLNRKSRMDVYLHNVKRNFVFFKFAPSEVLWAPIWKPCHFVWRKIKGYS